jgi:hypothetical protein
MMTVQYSTEEMKKYGRPAPAYTYEAASCPLNTDQPATHPRDLAVVSPLPWAFTILLDSLQPLAEEKVDEC